MSQHLAIFIRAHSREQLDAELGLVSTAMKAALKNKSIDAIYVVAGGHTGTKSEKEHLEKQVAAICESHARRRRVLPYLPEGIAQQGGELPIADLAFYARDTLLDRIVLLNGVERLLCLWRPDWPDAMVALQATISCTDTMEWWSPDGSRPWPSVPPGLRYRDLWRARSASTALDSLTGRSPAMERLRDQLREAARIPAPVMLVGETGTGKELCARALHELSGRTRMLGVNCALLDEHRAESTLFGHTKGAFTGAERDRDGRIREAEGGTLFLDEMLDLPPSVQAKLLRSLNHVEEAKIRVIPMGEADTKAEAVDVRVVSALQPEKLANAIRSDLYHRLSWVRIDVPPLKNRGGDAKELAVDMLLRLNAGDPPGNGNSQPSPITLGPDALKALASPSFYTWPGNVRELRVIIFRAWLRAAHRGKKVIHRSDLRRALNDGPISMSDSNDLKADVARYVVERYERTLDEHGGNKAKTARALGFKEAPNMGQTGWRYYQRHKEVVDG